VEILEMRDEMKPIRFFGMVLLLIFLLISECISANVISENHIERNSRTVLQLMVSVDSGSMSPNLNIGDLVIVENASKSDIITYAEAKLTGYNSFNSSGDVILYHPYGNETRSLIISRAIQWVEKGESMWENGPAAPFAGYITKGDHNGVIDQMAGQMFGKANMSYIDSHRDEIMNVGSNISLDKATGAILYKTENGTFVGEGISYHTPVKQEWIIGIVRTKIPYGSDWTK
jgi:signal peptidase